MSSDTAASAAADTTPSTANPDRDTVVIQALTGALVKACRQLGKAGQPSDALEIAATGWQALWTSFPDEAQRINGVMHFLARLEAELAAQNLEPGNGTAMSNQDPIIDLRPETPRRRHEIIFDSYKALVPGTGFVIINDHDPKPLWYQFDAEHKGEFSWDVLEDGPEDWRVRIGRVAAS